LKKASPLGLLALALAFAACGGNAGSPSDTTADAEAPGPSVVARPITITHKPVAVRHAKDMKPGADGLVGPEPKPIIPKAPPPRFLAYQDLIEGDGAEAHFGDHVSIQFVGAEYKNGKAYTSRWAWKAPYEFEVGSAGLIKGFNLGVAGMKVGGRRELIIPPAFADRAGVIGGIPDDETVIYVVDLLAVE
jgi:peptidylprolyl isomerase